MGRVAHAGAGLQHDAGEPADWDLRANASLVDEHKRAVEHIELAVLEKDDARPVFHGDRAKGNVRGIRQRGLPVSGAADEHQAVPKRFCRTEAFWQACQKGCRIDDHEFP